MLLEPCLSLTTFQKKSAARAEKINFSKTLEYNDDN